MRASFALTLGNQICAGTARGDSTAGLPHQKVDQSVSLVDGEYFAEVRHIRTASVKRLEGSLAGEVSRT
jgi:hypothetical protein